MKQKLLLLFALLLGSVSAWADGSVIYYTSTDNNVVWPKKTSTHKEFTVGEGTASFGANIESNSYSEADGKFKIVFDGKVTKIGKEAFWKCQTLATIEIPESVTSFEKTAFIGCTGLTSINIPNSVTSFGMGTFSGCTSLSSITLPESLVTIGATAFDNCTSLTSITIPASVTSIDKLAFQGCTGLTSVTIEGTPTLGDNVFKNCDLENLTINVTNSTLEYIAYLNSKGISDDKIKIEYHTLEDGKDYSHSISFESGEYTQITWKRTFAKDCWQALCLPFMLSKEEWSEVGTVAELTGVSGGVLQWTTLDGETEAGKPYIIKPKSANLEVEMVLEPRKLLGTTDWDEVISVTVDGYTVTGTYAEKTDMADCHAYALSDGDFYYTTDNAKTLKPYRIFLTVPSPSNAPIRNRVDGEAAGVESVVADGLATDGAAYSLQGVRVGEGYKGIVIVNGKKVIRK